MIRAAEPERVRCEVDGAFRGAMLRELTEVSRACGRGRLFRSTVIRWDTTGHWWLMNRPDAGWEETGRRYPSLFAVASEWSLRFAAVGRDRYSLIITVEPL